jgi:hypothetical protein
MPVLRAVVAIVAVAMLTISGSSALQHVHAYADHDHADHRHGLASHAHTPPVPQHQHDSEGPDGAAQLEGCDPGAHAVSVVFTGVAPRPEPAPVPLTLATVVVTSPDQVWRCVTPSDVRAHSPPRLTDAPLRAPPLVHPA